MSGDDGKHQRYNKDCTKHAHEQWAHPQLASPRNERRHGKDQRPNNEDLSLNGQGPKVLQGAGQTVVGGVVVHGFSSQEPILVVKERRPALPNNAVPTRLRYEEIRANKGNYKRDGNERKKPLEQVNPVFEQAQVASALNLAGELPVSKKAEMSRNMSTPPEIRPNQTW